MSHMPGHMFLVSTTRRKCGKADDVQNFCSVLAFEFESPPEMIHS